MLQPRVQNAPGYICETSPAGYTHGKAVVQRPNGVIRSPTWLGLILVWSRQNHRKFLKNVKVFRILQGLLPRDPPQKKSHFHIE